MQKIGISNPVIKTIKKLKKKSQNNLVVIEGLGVMEMALNSNIDIKVLMYCDELIYSDEAHNIKDLYEEKAENVYCVSKKVYETLADKDNSAGLIAVIYYEPLKINEVDFKDKDFVLVLNGLELPGNMGSIYRTSYAINIDLVIVADCASDINSSKFIASSRGVSFDVPTVVATYDVVQKKLLKEGYRIVLAEPEMGTSYNNFDYTGKIAIVVGSERYGINKNWYNNKHERIYIPMRENIKSLNVGIAASIILYDAAIKKGKIK